MNKNQVLKQRTLTGIIFGVIVITLIQSGSYGAILLALIIALTGNVEYIKMIFPREKLKLIICLSINILVIAGLLFIPPNTSIYLYISLLSCFMMVLGILNLYFPIIRHELVYWIVSVFYFGLPFGLFISHLYNVTPYLPYFWLSVLIMIWMSDSFAYLVGSRIGKHKLFEKISPKKSWEGFLGAGFIALPIAYWLGSSYFNTAADMYGISPASVGSSGLFWTMIAAAAWIIGTMGDLVESSIKRTFGIKDSGNILPGHGGILDRFDSFIYILPFVLFLLSFYSQSKSI